MAYRRTTRGLGASATDYANCLAAGWGPAICTLYYGVQSIGGSAVDMGTAATNPAPPPPAVPPVVPGALNNGVVLQPNGQPVYDAASAQAAIDAAIAAMQAQTQAQNQQFFGQVAAGSNNPVTDCSTWYASLNPACSGDPANPIPLWVFEVGGAIVGLLLLKALVTFK